MDRPVTVGASGRVSTGPAKAGAARRKGAVIHNQLRVIQFMPIRYHARACCATARAVLALPKQEGSMDPVEQAHRTVQEIRQEQGRLGELIAKGERSASERFDQLSRKVDELMRAQALIDQAALDYQRSAWNAPGGSVRDLSQYIQGDGTVRLVQGTQTIEDDELGFRGVAEVDGLFTGRPVCDLQREIQDALIHRASLRMVGCRATPKADGAIARLLRMLPKDVRTALVGTRRGIADGRLSRAFGDAAGVGGEFIPDTFSPMLWRQFELQSNVLSDFDAIPVDGPVVYPQLTGELTPYIMGRTVSDDPAKLQASSITTANKTLDVGGISVRATMAMIALEDAAAFVAPVMQEAVFRALRDGLEDCAINGDTQSTHQDTGLASWNPRSRWATATLGSAADIRRFFNGLRRLARLGSGTSDQTAATSFTAALLNVLALMGERAGARPIVYTSPEYYVSDVMADANLLTVDKSGINATRDAASPLAPISFMGVPIKPTRWLKEDKTAAGIYDGSTTSYDSFVVASRHEIKHAIRRGASVSLVVREEQGAIHLVGSAREALEMTGPAGTLCVGEAIKLN